MASEQQRWATASRESRQCSSKPNQAPSDGELGFKLSSTPPLAAGPLRCPCELSLGDPPCTSSSGGSPTESRAAGPGPGSVLPAWGDGPGRGKFSCWQCPSALRGYWGTVGRAAVATQKVQGSISTKEFVFIGNCEKSICLGRVWAFLNVSAAASSSREALSSLPRAAARAQGWLAVTPVLPFPQRLKCCCDHRHPPSWLRTFVNPIKSSIG